MRVTHNGEDVEITDGWANGNDSEVVFCAAVTGDGDQVALWLKKQPGETVHMDPEKMRAFANHLLDLCIKAEEGEQ